MDRWLHVARHRLRSILRGTRVEDDLNDEIRDHLECRVEALIAAGMTPAAARDAAVKAFGGVDQRKEECRDARGVTWLTDLGRDVRYAARLMRRGPGFTLVAVLSLALGIGATTAIFTLFDALLLKPLPVAHPDQLRVLHQELRVGGKTLKSGNLPYHRYEELRAAPEVFSEVIAFTSLPDVAVSTPRGDRPGGSALFVSDNYFATLGVTARRGRTLEGDTGHGALHEVVLGDTFWRLEFAAAPDVVGQTLFVNGVPFAVAGVTPPEFFGLTVGRVPDVYLPLEAWSIAQPAVTTLRDRSTWFVDVVGRLLPAVSAEVATARLSERWRFDERGRAGQPELAVRVLPIETGLTDVRTRLGRPLTLLLAMVGMLLLIACANVAGLLLSRAAARRDEMAMRIATGASRGRLIRQLMTESVSLAVVAGLVGTVTASWITNVLIALMPPGTIGTLELSFDVRILLFAAGVSLFAALASGMVPAFYAVKTDIASAIRERRAVGRRGGGLGRAFVIAQVALAMTLVVGAGLLLRTVRELTTLDPGFVVNDVVAAQVEPGVRQYTGDRLSLYYADLTERLRAMPGVAHVTLAQFGFLTGAGTTGTVDVPGYTPASDDERLLNVYQVGADYFTTLGVPIVQGRDFTALDLTGGAVAAINESAARRFFGDESALGRTLVTMQRQFEIVAVTRDARASALRDEPVPTFFVPYTSALRGRMTFLVRTATESAGPAAVSAAIRALDSEVPLTITTIDELHARNVSQERLLATLTTAFASAAVFLLALGVYGMMTFAVTQRTSEIGVRLALGSTRTAVMWSVLRQPLLLVAIGSAIGLTATLAGGRFIASLLFGLGPQDPLTLGSAILVLAIVGILAGLVPARRASRVDPVVALRCE